MGKLNDWRSRPRGPRPDVSARMRLAARTHGMNGTPTWKSWCEMLQRVRNPKCKDFHRYGGRGIGVDSRWLLFENFLADMGLKPDGFTLGRIENDEGYRLSNCRWETVFEQNNNRTSSRFVEIYGRTQTVAQWAREMGFSRQALRYRLDAGWTPQQSITIPLNYGNGRIVAKENSCSKL